jgi:hypothetical protein
VYAEGLGRWAARGRQQQQQQWHMHWQQQGGTLLSAWWCLPLPKLETCESTSTELPVACPHSGCSAGLCDFGLSQLVQLLRGTAPRKMCQPRWQALMLAVRSLRLCVPPLLLLLLLLHPGAHASAHMQELGQAGPDTGCEVHHERQTAGQRGCHQVCHDIHRQHHSCECDNSPPPPVRLTAHSSCYIVLVYSRSSSVTLLPACNVPIFGVMLDTAAAGSSRGANPVAQSTIAERGSSDSAA